jgi:hypothetical protein
VALLVAQKELWLVVLAVLAALLVELAVLRVRLLVLVRQQLLMLKELQV